MFCWLFSHNYIANPHDRDHNNLHCSATCSKCGKTKWINFQEYSLCFAKLVTISDNGTVTRHLFKTANDPWGRVGYKKLLDGMKLLNKQKYTLKELVDQITPENQHEYIDFGKPVGKEFPNEEE